MKPGPKADIQYTKKMMSVAEIVDKQYRKGRFNRMDMVMRLLCIDEYYENERKPGKMFKIYRKMQHSRILKIRHIRPDKFPKGFEQKRARQFVELIKSFEEKGYDMNAKAIRLDKDFELANGSHRMAMCIHFGIPEIPIKWPSDSTKPRRGYSLKWFTKRGFSPDIIHKLDARRKKMLNDLGLKDRETNSYPNR